MIKLGKEEEKDKVYKIKSIRKRDGRNVEFVKEKITNAVFNAAQSVGGKDIKKAEEIADKVVTILEYKFSRGEIPTVEEVQDIVERVLIKAGHAKTAKAYILYRKQRERIRETKSVMLDVNNTISDYIDKADWKVMENSNEQYSFSGLLLYSAGKIVSNYMLNEIYSYDIAEAHKKGYFHIHDLTHGVVGYCAGWSIKNLLIKGFGGVKNKVDCKPAKHLSTVVHQMVNYIGCLQMEFAGAQAFSSVDTYLAPFIKYEGLTYKEVKQAMQQLVFSLNIPSRWGCFSEDTEILTEEGWRPGKDLKVGDIIATFNTENEKIEYLPVKKVTKDNYKGKMYNLKNRIMDQLITPNHRVLRRIHNFDEGKSESKYVFEEASKLNTKIPLIPLGGKFKGVDMHEDYVRALAWIVSEGSLCKNERIGIHQSFIKNPQYCEEIRTCLNNLEIPFDEQQKLSGFTSERSCLRFRINRSFSRKLCNDFFPDYTKNASHFFSNKLFHNLYTVKKIPEEVRNLNTDLTRIFIDTYMKADGHTPENKIYTKSKRDADFLQEMIVKAGWGSTRIKNKNGIFVVRVIKHDYSQVTSIEQVDYDGIVWCPTTENNTVVVRRKGKVFISGNSQYPFTNLTFDLKVPEDVKDEKAIVVGKKQEFTYGDCQKEMDILNKAFLEVMKEGDANGRIFTFPIPTYNITKDFDWDSENAKLLFEVTAKYGTPYFQNYVGSGLDPKSIRAMCCRLNLNQLELMNRPGNMWGPGDNTGSVGVVTINLNRIGYEAKTKGEFFERLGHYMTLAKNSLETKRKIVEKNLKNGLMPYSKVYLGTFRNHFLTIGLCGMNECCLNFLGKDIASEEGKQFTIETLNFMRDKIKEFQKETGSLYNLEATPAESTSYRLARLDKEMYPKIITSGDRVPFLTNSTQLPVDYTDDIIEAIEHQKDIQPLYTGGTIFHSFFGERLDGVESVKRFVKKIAYNTKLPYFSITPTFSICPDHGYIKGKQEKCMVCGKETEVYSRIVGYFRPVNNWNPGKMEEFEKRVVFNEQKGLEKEFVSPIIKAKGG